MDAEIKKLKADRAEAKHYAAVLYAITEYQLALDAQGRALLANAIVAEQRKRGLID
jgi:hypothetical protein